MPIKFLVHGEEGYFVSKWSGELTDQEIMDAWTEFLNGPEWRPGLNELADVSNADISRISSHVIKQLADYTTRFYEQHNMGRPVKAAIFAPKQEQYGMSRMYAGWTDDSSELIRFFDDIAKAKKWLRGF